MQDQNGFPHTLTLDDREKLVVSGVSEVVSFDDNAVVLVTTCGRLTVRGSDIKVVSLDIDSTEKSVRLEGSFRSLEYGKYLGMKKGSLSERLFG